MADWGASADSGWGAAATATTSGGGAEWTDGSAILVADDAVPNDGGNDDAGGNVGGDRGCFNCGQPGHNKAECPNPRVVTGACRRCGEEGHWVGECPMPQECKNCGEKGHSRNECKAPRFVDRSAYEEMSTEDAWNLVKKAVETRDIDDVKEAVQVYVKSAPETTYVQLEEAFRSQDVKLWLIAIEKPNIAATLTNMDLQGNLEKKYTVTYRFQWNPPRPRERELWPADEAENLERLKDAGEVVPLGKPKCARCGEVGHISKSCEQEQGENDRNTIKCYNCDEVGHRVRDCPVPRVDKFACKNCGKSGHKVADCTEPRSAEGVECRKCNEVGHFSKDCPTAPRGCRNCGQEGHNSRECTEPRNPANIQCRNCDEFGHMSKECPKPRDITRVTCSNCQQKGHFKSKCPNPHVDDSAGGGGFGGDSGRFGDDGGFESAPVEASGGW